MDTKEIEQLRALAFASIPKAQRQPASGGGTVTCTPAPAGLSKSKRPTGENEEGEIVSDEEVAADGAQHLHLDEGNVVVSENGHTKANDAVLVTNTFCNAHVSVVTPNSANAIQRQREIPASKALIANVENGLSSVSKRLSTPVKRDAKFTHQRRPMAMTSPMTGTPRSSRSLPSRIPNAPLGVRKEADSFLASLNIPVTVGFTPVERDNSLVIKFTDDDSDSDREQQDQAVANDRKYTSNGLQQPNSVGLSTQSTDNLKSEIDRVKKQIAAIERIKGKPTNAPASKLCKSVSASDIAKQRSVGQISTSVVTGEELESLRQQIAAKENELQLRKQRKDPPSNSTVLPQKTDVAFVCTGDRECHNKFDLRQEVSDSVEPITAAKPRLNRKTGNSLPCSQVDEITKLGNSSNHRTIQLHEMSSTLTRKPSIATYDLNKDALPETQCNDPKLYLKATGTPKRKRDEGQRVYNLNCLGDGSESVKKKQKRDKSCLQNQVSCGNIFHEDQQEIQSIAKQSQNTLIQMVENPQIHENISSKKTPTISTSTTGDDGNVKEETRSSDIALTKNPNAEAIECCKNRHTGTVPSDGLQMVFIGTNSPYSSVPVWNFESQIPRSNIAVFHDVSDQRIEYSHETLQQWQEEEDLVDKELEEAQQNRRKCEVRERLARRQYRVAQESLRAANSQCEALYQKREMLSARIKAAELQFYSSKTPNAMSSQYDDGALVTVTSPGLSGRAPISFESPPSSKEDRNTLNLQDKSNESKSPILTDACPAKGHVSESKNPGLNMSSALKSDATEMAELVNIPEAGTVNPKDNRERLDHTTSINEFLTPGCEPKRKESFPKVLENVCSPVLGIDEDNSLTIDRNLPMVSTLTNANNQHGFCSASFATELERDMRPTPLVNSRADTVTHATTTAIQETQLLRTVSSDSLQEIDINEQDTVNNQIEYHYEASKTSKVDSGIHTSMPGSIINETLLPKYKYIECQQVEAMEIQPERTDVEVSQEIESLLVKDSLLCFSNERNADSQCPVVESEGMDKSGSVSEVNEEPAHLQSEGAFVDKQPKSVVMTESLTKELGMAKESKSSIPFVPSPCLKVLCRYATNVEMMKRVILAVEKQNSPKQLDENFQLVPMKYESPLAGFHSYSSGSASVLSKIPSRQHQIDPFKILCRFEHRGKCNNDECLWQHKRDYLVKDDGKTENEQDIILTERSNTNSIELPIQENIGKEYVAVDQKTHKWDAHSVGRPLYRIGPHLIKPVSSDALISPYICRQMLGYGQPFSGMHRHFPVDMPCLFDSSVNKETVSDRSLRTRLLPVDDKSRLEIEGNLSSGLQDTETLMESALELIDYDFNVEKTESHKTVLYILSRGLEVISNSAALWVVYLHLFYRWEKSIGDDDLFYHAVQYNKDSYELWIMFINSRQSLLERMQAYDSALLALASSFQAQGHCHETGSSFLLDLCLQKLNFMCVSGLYHEATNWIENLTSAAEDGQEFSEPGSITTILLNSLTVCDLCILWICCAYVIIEAKVPAYMIENLGCNQRPCFKNIWSGVKPRRSLSAQAMKLMRVAASQNKGCMGLDTLDSAFDADTQLAKEVFACNLVQCSAACEGLECSLTWAEKYFDLYQTSVEVILVRVQLEEHMNGKMACLEIFEKALHRWPLHQTGKMRLWNQYLGYAFEVRGRETVKTLLDRFAAELHRSDSFEAAWRDFGSSFSPSESEQRERNTNNAFELLPEVVKRQLTKGNDPRSQAFSYEDAVFGYLSLAFCKALDGYVESAIDTLHNALNIAATTDVIQHCLNEIAALTVGNPGNFTSNTVCEKMLQLFDRCYVESQLIVSAYPLSKVFFTTIKKRRLRSFVEYLLGPSPIDFSFLNSALESLCGPAMLPMVPLRDLIDFTDKVLEVMPGNAWLALSACRTVESRLTVGNTLMKSATLFWSISVLVDSLCQASPQAPEPLWVEAGHIVRLLDVDNLTEDFYHLALSVYPFSTTLWSCLLSVSSRTGKLSSNIELASRKGIKVDLQSINQ